MSLGRKLGEGRSPVFEARDEATGERFAFKLMKDSAAAHNEAELLQRIKGRGKNLMAYEGLAAAGVHPGVLMELVEGSPLSQSGPRPLKDAARLIRHALRGLRLIHESGLVHTDVHSDHVFETASGGKLIDVGSAAQIGVAGGAGSWEYMPPEQFAPREARLLGPSADTYAATGLLVRLLIGRNPFRGEGEGEAYRQSLLEAHRTGKVDFDYGELPEPVRAIVQRGLDPDPSKRFRTANELLDALRPL